MLTPHLRRFLRRLGAGVLAWAVAVAAISVMMIAGPTAAAPAPPPGCDANGDRRATGTTGEIFTNGADAAAGPLRSETGLALARARPAYVWRVTRCVEVVDDAEPATADRFVVVVGTPVEERNPEAGAWEAKASTEAVADLVPQLYRPGTRTSPHVAGVQVIGIEMWLAIDPGAWVALTATASEAEVGVTATATPSKMVWEFSDGVTRVCDGPGVPYSPGAAGRPPCGRSFERTSEVRPVVVSVSIDYTTTWTSTLANAATLSQRGEANRYELVVGEVQTYLSDGRRPAPGPIAAPGDPASTQPMNDKDCAWSSPWDCSATDILDAVSAFATDAVWATLPESAKVAVEMVWSFIKGCAAFVGDALGSIQEVLTQLKEVVTDPQGFLDDKLDLARSLSTAVKADTEGFATEFVLTSIDAELLASSPATWADKVGCEIAIGLLTGGVAAATRFADAFGDVAKFSDRIRDWLRRRDSNDSGGPRCRVSSFPTGTEVAMGDGSRRPIEAIRPGDTVWAFDADDGSWAARAVLRQWSYLDTDEMATLRLGDGSTVTATDDHRFWSATRGDFAELETLAPGERLMTPQGPVVVDTVTVWPSAPTLVWELTVAVDHTFAVFAGDNAVAVHNNNGCHPPSAAEGEGISISEKIAGQMGPRGWTEEAIGEAVATPAATHPVWDYTTGSQQPATAYVRPDGSYVVVNDSTRTVVQVSDASNPNWKPVWNDPRFQR